METGGSGDRRLLGGTKSTKETGGWVGHSGVADPAHVSQGPGWAESHLSSHLVLKKGEHNPFQIITVLPGDPGANVAFLRKT